MATTDVGSSKGKARRWTHEEDTVLVSCLVDLHNLETKNADTRFKGGYLYELEKMLQAKLPTLGIKVKPHIESRVKTLKKEWTVVHDLFTNNNSGFGWDDEKKMVTAEDDVWDSYISSHKEAVHNGEDADDVEIPNMNFTFTENQSPSGIRARNETNSESSSAKKKRKNHDEGEPITSQTFHTTAQKLSDTLVLVGDKIGKSIIIELTLQEKVQQLDTELSQVDGLSNEEYLIVLIKLPDCPNQMLVFFSLPPHRRLQWVKAFLATN
ncbi:uncharacterized protein At2g29880-like [Ipomoea triloba]|uniref:uncharacterized protein At2g29880-like n=1 Tax=Ipomoea triloba TaxID=35885 RepID=UPI00125CF7B6|nr:uncharacterized protein At2g29880-like [Ipomoea triloba]